jgi:acyl-coenzyme A thioesterase PaaI-like protein
MNESEPKGPAAGGSDDRHTLSLQARYAPHNACFGCGPSNPKGLQLQSYVGADGVVATFRPEPHHEAFPGVLNGGIIGALLDCHSNWTAAHALMLARGEATPPCTVTAEFHVKLRHPTPTDVPVALMARSVQVSGGPLPDRCTVDAELSSGGKVTATCRGIFVAVNEGHPAYHRW